MGLRSLGSIPIAVLLATTFGLYGAVGLEFALQLAAYLAISVSVGIGIPDLEEDLDIAADVTLGIDAGVEIGLPSVTASLALGLSAEVTIIAGLLATISALLKVQGASLQAYTYGGTVAQVGDELANALEVAWPDGTPANDNIEALILVATSSGSTPVGTLDSIQLLGGGQGYERGLCSVQISGNATATPTISTSSPNPNPPPTNLNGVLTGVTVTANGSGYEVPPTVTISDTVAILGATNTTPIVVSLPSTTDVTAVTLADVQGNDAANGSWCAKVLSSTTIALYQDTALSVPVAGNGAWVSGTGTLTGNGVGAAAVPIMGGGSIAQLQGFFSGLTFADGLVESGSITVGDILELTFGLLGALDDELELRLSALATASLNFGVVPPTVGGNLEVVAGIVANLKAALQFFPPLPSIQANLQAGANARVALVEQLVAAIAAQIGFSTEDLAIYVYSGPGTGLGPALSSTLPSTTGSVVVLGATTPAASAALDVVFPAAA